MFYQALSLPEVLVLLCGIGAVGRIANRRLQVGRSQALWRGITFTPIDCSVLLLVLAALVAGLAASDLRAALFELRSTFLLPVLYYVLLRLARPDDRAGWWIVDGLVLGAAGVALVGLVQYVLGCNVVIAEGGLPRLQSVYYSPNNVGLYLGRVWPLIVAVVLWGKGHPSPDSFSGRVGENISPGVCRRVLYGMALVLVTVALVLSFSRGALLLGLPAALLVMGWWAGGRYRWGVLVLVVVGALVLIPLLRVPRFASMLDLQQGSAFFRLELWRSSLALIRDHPWFGVGPGNFLDAYRTRYVLPSAWEEFNMEHPHNVYLDHWTRLGLLGLLAGVAVQVAFFRSPIASREAPILKTRIESISLGLVGSMAALLAHGLVDNTLFFPDLALAFFLILALAQQGRPGEA